MSKIVREIEAMQAPSLNAHDTVTLSRELAERIRRMCVPIKAEVATYNEFEAALAAPQPTIKDDLTVAHSVKQALIALVAEWNHRCKTALPADAMLINKHIRELRESIEGVKS